MTLNNNQQLAGKSNLRSLLRFVKRELFERPAGWIHRQKLPREKIKLNVNGYTLEVFSPRENKISQHIYEHGIWEPEVTEFAKQVIKPGMCVWDVGADVGYFSLLFSSLADGSGAVVAFEPIPKAREQLQKNISLNSRQNITIESRALGRNKGTLVLEKPMEVSRINLGKPKADPGDIVVEVVKADELLHKHQKPDVIKIDVEGAEFEILSGMEQLLLEHKPNLILELHGPYLPLFGTTSTKVVDWLTARGYSLSPIDKADSDRDSKIITYWVTHSSQV